MRPPLAPERDTQVGLSIATFKLANGLRVVHVQDPRISQVQVTIRYNVGAIDDPTGQEGLAHLVEHLAFAQRVAGESISQRLAAAAALYNATTTLDATTFVSRAPASKLADLLAIEAARLRSPCDDLPNADFERERDVVLNEIRYRERSTEVYQALRRALLPADHPYNRSVSGTADSVGTITRDQAWAFANAHYAVRNAVLVVSGDLSRERLEAELADLATVRSPGRAHRRKVPLVKLERGEGEASVPLDRTAVVFVWRLPDDAELQAKYRALAAAAAELIAEEIRGTAMVFDPAGSGAGLIAMLVTGANGETEGNLLNGTDRALRGLPMMLERHGVQELDQLGFSRTQHSALFRLYAQLDDALERDPMLAEYVAVGGDAGVGVHAPIEALRRLTRDEAIAISKAFDYDAAKIVTLKPTDASSRQRVTLRSTTDAIEEERAVTTLEDARAPAQDAPGAHVAEATTRKLPNGLTVILHPSTTAPFVDIRLVFDVGSGDEPDTRRGIATLAARGLYFDERYVKDALAFATAGGQFDYNVDFDRTVFAVRGEGGELDYLLAGLRRVVREGSYRGVSEFAQKVQRAHREADPAADAWRRAIYGADHPYAKAGLLRHADDTLSAADARAFHTAYYTPGNATLVIGGNFDPAVIDRWVDFLFGDWRGDATTRTAPATTFTAAAFSTLEPQDHIDLAIAFDASRQTSTRAARLVAAEMLAELARGVRLQLAASYDASAELIERRLAATYSITMGIDGTRAPDAAKLLSDGLAKLRTDPQYAARTFVAARRRVLMSLALIDDSTARFLDRVERDIALGYDLAGLNTLAEDVRKLTIDQMSAALAEVDMQRSVIAMRGAGDEMRRTFDALGRRPQQLGPRIRPDADYEEAEHPAPVEFNGVEDVAEPLTRPSSPFHVVYAVNGGWSFATLTRATPGLDQSIGYGGPALSGAFGYRRRGATRLGLRLDMAWLSGTTHGATPRDVGFGVLALGPFVQTRLSGPFWFAASAAVRIESADEVATGGLFAAELGLDLIPTKRGWLGLTARYGYVVATGAQYGELLIGAALRH